MIEQVVVSELEGPECEARLNRYRVFDEVNAPYLRWQLAQISENIGERVLEVGCGVGSILAQLGPRSAVMGIDLEDELIGYVRRRFAMDPAYSFATLDISRLSPIEMGMLKARHFDSIVSINVLEHVEDDEAAMRAMAGIVAPGGYVSIVVPAHPALYGAYDRMEGHFRRYSRDGLRRLVAKSGLQLVKLHRFNALGALGWWVQYRLLRQTIHGQSHFKVLQAVMPVMWVIEGIVKPPFGLSLVAVARRPENSV
jgi:SAM-dependent methyltransferase